MKRLIACLLIAATCAAVESVTIDRRYKIYNVTGPVSGREGDFRLHLRADRLTVENKRTRHNIEIAGAQISSVMYTPVRFSRVEQNPIPLATGGACYGQGCGGEVLLYIAAAMILAPMHGHSHYIRITWSDRDVEQQLQFEIGKDDCGPLLDALKSFSGVKYMDVEEEARHVHHELEQNVSKAVNLKLEHASKLGDYDLPSGNYKMIALNREHGEADLYVIAALHGDTIEPTSVKAAVRSSTTESAGEAGIEYVAGSSRVSAIRTADHVFRLETAP